MEQREIIRYGSVQEIAAVQSLGLCRYPRHWHNAAEFILALKDSCVYRVGEAEYRLNQGDLLLIWPRELHEVVSLPENGTLFIQFSAGLLESNRDLAVSVHMLRPLRWLRRSEHIELTRRLADLVGRIMNIYSSGDFYRETRCKLEVYQIMLLLAEYAQSAKIRDFETASFSSDAWRLVQQACAFINARFTDDLRQREVAAAVGLSPCYFSRLFKRYVQSSFPEYLARVRIHEAVRLLANSVLSITECAYRAGFQSSTAFNKAFLEITGNTPREYRRLYQNAQDLPERAYQV